MLIKQLSFLSGYALPPIQINFDVCLAQGLILLPFFMFWDTNKYTTNDLWLTSLGYFLANTGSIFQTYALKYGQGAITQSFINLNAVWQTIIMIVSSGGKMTPTTSQIMGIGSGLTGACIVALSSQDSSADVAEELI